MGAVRATDRRLLLLATGAGVLWGFVMAWVAWRRDGAEVVLLQAWILGAAFGFGSLAATPRLGALAGLAVVFGAVWTYELLPAWGVEATLTREGASPAELEFLAARLDADDIVLLTTLVIGALVGLGGALRPPAAPVVHDEAEVSPAAAPPPPPPAPLWAGFEAPRAPEPEVATQTPAPAVPAEDPAPPRDPVATRRRILSGALLLAALGTDFMLDRVFGFYTEPQAAVGVAFVLAGLVGVTVLARRLAPAAALLGLVLALAFGAVQHAEYDDRRPPEAGGLIR